VSEQSVRLIAFYLPQFHPIPENNTWWGNGFTEWTNVARARPLFRGHDQPRRPADLGYYDLRVPETRAAQAELARLHGLEGFCYWHYWFEGRRLLERPFHEVLTSGEPDFPFCLAWANETWSRRWLGEERDILLQQTYSAADDRNHARWLLQAFADPRYIRVHGRPVFLIYRPLDLPDPRRTTDTFRDEAVKNGLAEPYLIGIDAHFSQQMPLEDFGFDSTLDFRPQLGDLPQAFDDRRRLGKLMRNWSLGAVSARLKLYDCRDAHALMSQLVASTALKRSTPFPQHPCVFVGWDNTPRRGRDAIIILNSSPELFRERLQPAFDKVSHLPLDERLVFVNAWNEWAEGNYLEPDATHGHGFLKALALAYATHNAAVSQEAAREYPHVEQPS
jgi:lipopolysaccharide biosynthesis protein